MSILIPSDDYTGTTTGRITWTRGVGIGVLRGFIDGKSAFFTERANGGQYRLWSVTNGHCSPLTTFATTSDAVAHAEALAAE
jgi:hypothetical protein